MLVLDILMKATLHGVALNLADHIGLGTYQINEQLRKAIEILSCKPEPSDGSVVIRYVKSTTEPSYYAVSGVYDEDPEHWCIAIVPWVEWLSMPVCVHGPALSNDEMAALILYEMTSAGAPKVV